MSISRHLDLDDILKVPELTDVPEENMEDFQERICRIQKMHDAEMASVESDIEKVKKSKEEFVERQKRNAELREILSSEVTEDVVRKLFKENLEYLRDIWNGEANSERHRSYCEGANSRPGLYYIMVTDPFTDDQLKWTLEEISKGGIRISVFYIKNVYLYFILFHQFQVEAKT